MWVCMPVCMWVCSCCPWITAPLSGGACEDGADPQARARAKAQTQKGAGQSQAHRPTRASPLWRVSMHPPPHTRFDTQTNQSINQPTNQSTNQSTNQPINHPTTRSPIPRAVSAARLGFWFWFLAELRSTQKKLSVGERQCAGVSVSY